MAVTKTKLEAALDGDQYICHTEYHREQGDVWIIEEFSDKAISLYSPRYKVMAQMPYALVADKTKPAQLKDAFMTSMLLFLKGFESGIKLAKSTMDAMELFPIPKSTPPPESASSLKQDWQTTNHLSAVLLDGIFMPTLKELTGDSNETLLDYASRSPLPTLELLMLQQSMFDCMLVWKAQKLEAEQKVEEIHSMIQSRIASNEAFKNDTQRRAAKLVMEVDNKELKSLKETISLVDQKIAAYDFLDRQVRFVLSTYTQTK